MKLRTATGVQLYGGGGAPGATTLLGGGLGVSCPPGQVQDPTGLFCIGTAGSGVPQDGVYGSGWLWVAGGVLVGVLAGKFVF